ncbi:hypothetical protein MmiAt1_02690 [Methanimicrococcus sp. At1]|uniref:SD-repeat containing protein B domain-containing protein n=1 Tax=Methanimicrococcus hacksteinii TaxID=3028293 RepID=A0ABU3VMV6_9EURY|nr:SdrD B-like domain-containing protein [Methanimicrococcus sp. At1]MDV0444733.1 hypothetical protein [Methanimicrococcus sp. At1]
MILTPSYMVVLIMTLFKYPEDNVTAGGIEIIKFGANSSENGLLIMEITDISQISSLDISIRANSSMVYQNENNTIKAGIYKKDTGDKYTLISNIDTLYAVNKFLNLTNGNHLPLVFTSAVGLTNPPLPSEEGDVNAYYTVNYASSMSQYYNYGTRLTFDSLELDFSDVVITTDGVPDSYANWIANSAPGDSPVIFTTLPMTNYATSESGTSVIFTPAGTTRGAFVSYTYLNFSIQTTDDFKPNATEPASINFSALKILPENLRINGRGPVIDDFALNPASPVASTLTSYTTISTLLSGYDPSAKTSLSASIVSGVGSGNYTIAYSEQFAPSSIFYEQLLFQTSFSNKKSGVNNTIHFEIPPGVTVTHLGVPKVSSFNEYEAIYLVHGGTEYLLMDTTNKQSLKINLSDKFGITLSPDEDVYLKFVNMTYLRGATASGNTLGLDYKIKFYGTTDSSVQNGNALSYFVYDYEDPFAPVQLCKLTTYATTDYIVMYSLKSQNYLTETSLVDRGDTFQMHTSFGVSGYPYSSYVSTNRYSNPVVYFSVPAGLTIGDVSVTSGSTPITSLKDSEGRALNFTPKPVTTLAGSDYGLYGDSDGQLIEVKIHLDGVGNENLQFWMNQTLNVSMEVTVPPDYPDSSINFKKGSVLVSTWDPNARGTGGQNMATLKLNETNGFPDTAGTIAAKFNDNGGYYIRSVDHTLTVSTPKAVITSAGVKIGTGYSYYDPLNPTSYPTLHAGSENEEFKLYFTNLLDEPVGTTADPTDVYFILPVNENWITNLMKQNSLDVTATGFSSGSYKIYYTDYEFKLTGDSFEYTTESLNALEAGALTWTEFPNDLSSMSDSDWGSITGIKCEFVVADPESSFELKLPFRLPTVDLDDNLYDTVAIGQTLSHIVIPSAAESADSNKLYTAAVKLTQSKEPLIFTYENTDVKEFTDSSLEYKSADSVDWYNVITADDQTRVKLFNVTVKFKGAATGATETILELDEDDIVLYFNSSDYSTETPETYIGTKYTINDSAASNPLSTIISTGSLGEYTVEYTTTEDNDSQDDSVSFKIQITKTASKISISGEDEVDPIYIGADVPEGGWPAYIRSEANLQVVDYGDTISADKIVYDTSGAFDPDVPGSYTLSYSYTDVLSNTVKKSVKISVLNKDTLNVLVTSNGVFVPGLEITVSSDDLGAFAVFDSDTGLYSAEIRATKTNPPKIDYNLKIDEIPKGLVSSAVPIEVTGLSVTYPDKAETYSVSLDPVEITVNLEDEAPVGVQKISLYKVGSDVPLLEIDVSEADPALAEAVFGPSAGEWFADGTYYLTAQLIPGYELQESLESLKFNKEISSILELKTENFDLAHEDVSIDLSVREAPMISGRVWNDENKDSLMDPEEYGISSAEVLLWDDSLSADPLMTATTDLNGNYVFVGLEKDVEYIVQIKMPSGYNQASAYTGDQSVDSSSGFNSSPVTLTDAALWEELNAGFYKTAETRTKGPGYGQATVVGGTASGGTQFIDTMGGDETGFTREDFMPEILTKNWWWLLVLLAILVFVSYYVWDYRQKQV